MKKSIAIALVLALALALAACGSNGGNDVTTDRDRYDLTAHNTDASGTGQAMEGDQPGEISQPAKPGQSPEPGQTPGTSQPPETSQPPVTTSSPTPSGEALAAAYSAYYNALIEAVNEYGIGVDEDPNNQGYDAIFEQWLENAERGVYPGQGVYYAQLVCFGDSTLPQLLYVYDTGYGPGRYVCLAMVIGAGSGGAELYYTGIIGGDSGEIASCFATDRNGVLYIHDGYYGGYVYDDDDNYYPTVENYYTIRNGSWVEVPANEIDIIGKTDFEYSPGTVRAVLAELEAR